MNNDMVVVETLLVEVEIYNGMVVVETFLVEVEIYNGTVVEVEMSKCKAEEVLVLEGAAIYRNIEVVREICRHK